MNDPLRYTPSSQKMLWSSLKDLHEGVFKILSSIHGQLKYVNYFYKKAPT